mmetsp:Transcript_24406/g.78880  ORF Transcript_24406/g.78880 Transcript_24406/m.78880 type:complete len:260 (-) Transcript_24406:137-916(-)
MATQDPKSPPRGNPTCPWARTFLRISSIPRHAKKTRPRDRRSRNEPRCCRSASTTPSGSAEGKPAPPAARRRAPPLCCWTQRTEALLPPEASTMMPTPTTTTRTRTTTMPSTDSARRAARRRPPPVARPRRARPRRKPPRPAPPRPWCAMFAPTLRRPGGRSAPPPAAESRPSTMPPPSGGRGSHCDSSGFSFARPCVQRHAPSGGSATRRRQRARHKPPLRRRLARCRPPAVVGAQRAVAELDRAPAIVERASRVMAG